MKYKVYAVYSASKYLGEIEAKNETEANEKAWDELSDEMFVSICHQCSSEVDIEASPYELEVEPVIGE